MDALVGRLAELAELNAFLARAADAPAAAMIEGAAGIGKTTLWQAGLDQARSEHRHVLACRPVEVETQLAFAGLGDLLADHADQVLPGLPPPQRRALEVALLRTDGTVPTADPRSVGVAVGTALHILAGDRPLVVAVDDVQWLDAPTHRVLAFALRRLRDQPIGLLMTRRDTEDAGPPPDLVAGDGIGTDAYTRLTLGPLNLRELRRLLADHLGEAPLRPLLVRIAAQSGGNPLYALEIARAVARAGGMPSPAAPLALPRLLGDLVADRIASLAPPDRRVLLLVAAAGNPSEAAVCRQPGADEALDRAEAAGLVERASGRVRFTHPLLASALYGGATSRDRRAAHRTLADAVDDSEERARNLALTTDTANEVIADALDDAANSAAGRGAPDAAVELLELALRHTPESAGVARATRTLALARHRFRAGDAPGATALAQSVRTASVGGDHRAEALLLLANIEHETGSAPAAFRLCEEALATADDVGLRARLHAAAANVSYHDFRVSARHARLALELLAAADTPDPTTESLALLAVVGTDLVLGRGFRREDAERAIELERSAPPARVADRASAALGAMLVWVDELDAARVAFIQVRQTAVDEGDDSSLPYALSHLPQLELRAGNWAAAQSIAAEWLELAESTGQEYQCIQARYIRATIDAHLGRVESTRTAVHDLLEGAEASEDEWLIRQLHALLGFLECSLGELETARPHLEKAEEIGRRIGIHDPGQRRESIVLAEVLIGLGETDRAETLVADIERDAERLDRPAWRAKAARCRALLRAAVGDVDGAIAATDEALRQHERVMLPFDHAETLLTVGILERRRRRKAAARRALESAHATFARLGAEVLRDRAAAELARIQPAQAEPGELTPTERRIAAMAAAGRTNREVAAALSLSAKTIEANLARVYRKLQIRSRAELGSRMSTGS